MPTTVRLLQHEPDLAAGLTAAEAREAEREVVVPVLTLTGPYVQEQDLPPGVVVVLDGVLVREIGLADRRMAQLSGPGDLLTMAGGPHPDLPAAVRWTVLEATRVAVLDATFAAACERWPAISGALRGRYAEQTERTTMLMAVAALPRVEQRILGLLWMLAGRWGRMTVDGAALPLPLTHTLLADLVGAKRPTVTLALGLLADEGLLSRSDDGGYVLAPGSERTLAAADAPPRPAGMARLRPPRPAEVGITSQPAPGTPESREALLADLVRLREQVRVTRERATVAVAQSRRCSEDVARVRALISARTARP